MTLFEKLIELGACRTQARRYSRLTLAKARRTAIDSGDVYWIIDNIPQLPLGRKLREDILTNGGICDNEDCSYGCSKKLPKVIAALNRLSFRNGKFIVLRARKRKTAKRKAA